MFVCHCLDSWWDCRFSCIMRSFLFKYLRRFIISHSSISLCIFEFRRFTFELRVFTWSQEICKNIIRFLSILSFLLQVLRDLISISRFLLRSNWIIIFLNKLLCEIKRQRNWTQNSVKLLTNILIVIINCAETTHFFVHDVAKINKIFLYECLCHHFRAQKFIVLCVASIDIAT